MSAWGLYIFISMWFKIFCLIREQHTDAWNIVHKIFSTSSKKKPVKTSDLCASDWCCLREECMSCDWHGVVWCMIVGNMAHTRGVLLHFWVLQPAPETLLTVVHIAQLLFKQGNWFQFEPCTQSNAYALLSKRRQSSKFAGPKIRNNWKFSLVRCTGLPTAVHPCILVACAAARFWMGEGQRNCCGELILAEIASW